MDNFQDCGVFIKLIVPIGGIYLISKNPQNRKDLDAKNFNPNKNQIGGVSGWRIPTLENCETISKIVRENGNILNLEDGWIQAYSEKDHRTYTFNVFSGEKHIVDSFWPWDLCWVKLQE